MKTETRQFDRFVSAVHRRAVVMAMIERVGLTLAVAAGVACLLAIAAGWRGVGVWPIVLAILGLSVVVGIAWGVIRRPTTLDAVMQADQQLHLADLLSSALMVGPADFGSAVGAMADRACAKHSPSDVLLARYGVRAWSGIGLAWAMVIVITLLASNGSDTRAQEKDSLVAQGLTDQPRDPFAPATANRNTRTPGGREASSDNRSNMGAPNDPRQAISNAANAQGKPAVPAVGSGQEAGTTGHALVDPTRTAVTGQPDLTSPIATQSATGDGAGTTRTPSDGNSSAGRVAARAADRTAPPWASDRWASDREAALHAVQSGQVPDAYRDLVRDYFTPAAGK